jgi:hypothetical protein
MGTYGARRGGYNSQFGPRYKPSKRKTHARLVPKTRPYNNDPSVSICGRWGYEEPREGEEPTCEKCRKGVKK